MEQFFKFTKIYDVKSPTRGTSKSAGIDFFIPNYSQAFIEELKSKNKANSCHVYNDQLVVMPNQDVLIPSGLHVSIPDNTMLMVANKSGVAVKSKLVHGAHIVDNDYKEQVYLHVFNLSDKEVQLMFGQKIIQGILVPVLFPEPQEVDSLEDLYANVESERTGGFGSTGLH